MTRYRCSSFAGRYGRVRVVLAFEEPFGPNSITAVCEIGSHGQCLDPPPDVRSFTATLGARRLWANRIALGVNGGIGEVADRRWGAPQGAITGEFDLALRARRAPRRPGRPTSPAAAPR